MPPSMSQEKEREFSDLLKYIDFVMTKVLESATPLTGTLSSKVEEIAIRFGRSKALDGLRQAANDTVEMLTDLTPEQIEAIDQALQENNILTLSEVRRRYSAAYRRIVKRGAIKTETEYHLVAGLLADLTAHVSPEERSQLEAMVAAFSR